MGGPANDPVALCPLPAGGGKGGEVGHPKALQLGQPVDQHRRQGVTAKSPQCWRQWPAQSARIRRAAENSWLGTVYPAMPAMATTIRTTGETIEASTAADPTTSPPKIDAVCPMGPGKRRPAS